MSWSKIYYVTLGLIFMYLISQILKVFGLDVSEYGIYIIFYSFLILSVLFLPTKVSEPLS